MLLGAQLSYFARLTDSGQLASKPLRRRDSTHLQPTFVPQAATDSIALCIKRICPYRFGAGHDVHDRDATQPPPQHTCNPVCGCAQNPCISTQTERSMQGDPHPLHSGSSVSEAGEESSTLYANLLYNRKAPALSLKHVSITLSMLCLLACRALSVLRSSFVPVKVALLAGWPEAVLHFGLA